MNNAALEKVFAAPNLPTLPAVALKVLELTNRPDVQLRQVASVIENDQAIATKVLRTINSSFYALSRRCGSIQQAIALLGLQTVKGLVLGFSLAKSMDGGGEQDIGFDFMTYWRRCIYTAASARHLATLTRRCDPEEAFVAALVQDVGMVALWRAYGDRYLQIVDAVGKDHRRLVSMERKAMEVDHATVAGEMTRRWRFPESVIEAVRFHHDSERASLATMQIARTVELAGMATAIVMGETPRPYEAMTQFRNCAFEWFDIKGNIPASLLQVFADKAQDMARMFGLNVGASPDIDAILEHAARARDEQALPTVDLDDVLEADCREQTDPVTGLPDKTVFLRDIEGAFQQSSSGGSVTGTGIGVIVAALDDGKQTNEKYGVSGGDAALRFVAESLSQCTGRFGRAYRFVGVAVIALLPKVDLEQLCRVAEATRAKVAESVVRVGGTSATAAVKITASCGVAICEGDAGVRASSGVATRDELLKAAMCAVSTAQQQKNKVVLFRKDVAAKAA
ncbi:MAG: GGDEF domain-containing protein [Phycisphaerae bacterium]|nr:GGDEF domain-containing protein [Phycisphaerae bacterium]